MGAFFFYRPSVLALIVWRKSAIDKLKYFIAHGFDIGIGISFGINRRMNHRPHNCRSGRRKQFLRVTNHLVTTLPCNRNYRNIVVHRHLECTVLKGFHARSTIGYGTFRIECHILSFTQSFICLLQCLISKLAVLPMHRNIHLSKEQTKQWPLQQLTFTYKQKVIGENAVHKNSIKVRTVIARNDVRRFGKICSELLFNRTKDECSD